MLNLVYGGSGSGKSEFAEQLAVLLAQQCNGTLYYIATMKPWDMECRKRIEKHQAMRAEKHFKTIECYEHVNNISFPEIQTKPAPEQNEVIRTSFYPPIVLLECLSNLTANEMFGESCPDSSILCNRLFSDIMVLYKKTEHLIIVTNNIFEDGTEYDPETVKYQKLLAGLNQKLAKEADCVYKVTAGIVSALKMASVPKTDTIYTEL